MMPLPSEKPELSGAGVALPTGAQGFLNHLRFVAMNCRSKPRTDLFEACALLQVTRGATLQAHAEALMRCLPEALGKPAKLHAPGVSELSFDESWLVQLGIASAGRDHASMTFLLHSRVVREHRRLVSFLVSQISDSFHII